MVKKILERDIVKYLTAQAKAVGGEVRKVEWVGRSNAPDKVLMLPERWRKDFYTHPAATLWVEVKNPDTIRTFPANAHERAQAREHARMRRVGQRVVVVGTYKQVDELLR